MPHQQNRLMDVITYGRSPDSRLIILGTDAFECRARSNVHFSLCIKDLGIH